MMRLFEKDIAPATRCLFGARAESGMGPSFEPDELLMSAGDDDSKSEIIGIWRMAFEDEQYPDRWIALNSTHNFKGGSTDA